MKQQLSKDKLASNVRDVRKPNGLQLSLDVDQITNEKDPNTQTSAEAKDNKTP